jgi:hypothetical protein
MKMDEQKINAEKISKLFSKYAGKNLDGLFSHDGCPVLTEMFNLAKENGLKLRLAIPGLVDRNDLSSPPDRVSVYANRRYDGSFYIGVIKQG